MCNRFPQEIPPIENNDALTEAEWEKFLRRMRAQTEYMRKQEREKPEIYHRSINIPISAPAVVVTNHAERRAQYMGFGVVPVWSKTRKPDNRTSNSRSEKLGDSRLWDPLASAKRCLVPVPGWYEFQKHPSGKGSQVYLVRLDGRRLFYLAAIYSDPVEGGPAHPGFSLVTTEPNELIKQVHHRMPIALQEEMWDFWLDPQPMEPEMARDLLKPVPADEMSLTPLSSYVNSVGNKDRDQVVAIGDPIRVKKK